MNILILNWRDIKHPLAGGAEISLFEHAKYWKKQGAKITWFASFFNGAKKEEEIEGINILRFGSQHTVFFWFFLMYLMGKLPDFDVVVDCFHFLPFFSPLYIKRKKIIALINEVAGSIWFSNIFLPLALIGYLIEPLFFIFYKNKPFITSSKSTFDELVKLGIPRKNINIVYHGVTTRKLNDEIVKEKNPTIIFLGRVSEDKGIKDALKAFGTLSEKIDNLQFWIAGREERRGYLNKLLSDDNLFKLNSRIEYFDYVSENEKFELLKRAWILVHPSKKEGWGLTVIEANSQGVPTVGYNTEGLKDSILHMKTGMLTENNTPQGLAESLGLLIEDHKLYDKLSKNALDWSENFSWNKAGEMSWKVIGGIYAKKN